MRQAPKALPLRDLESAVVHVLDNEDDTDIGVHASDGRQPQERGEAAGAGKEGREVIALATRE